MYYAITIKYYIPFISTRMAMTTYLFTCIHPRTKRSKLPTLRKRKN